MLASWCPALQLTALVPLCVTAAMLPSPSGSKVNNVICWPSAANERQPSKVTVSPTVTVDGDTDSSAVSSLPEPADTCRDMLDVPSVLPAPSLSVTVSSTV